MTDRTVVQLCAPRAFEPPMRRTKTSIIGWTPPATCSILNAESWNGPRPQPVDDVADLAPDSQPKHRVQLMERRTFLKTSLIAGAAASTGTPLVQAQRPFTMTFAPHFGMFEAHAGQDLVAQLQFMADEGFAALEDNGMRGRPVAEQERIAGAMARHNMRMGVFVAHTIYWREPNLTSGDDAARIEFLDEIRGSVEVAKRVNATWMTVVPGHVDLRSDMGYQTANVVE